MKLEGVKIGLGITGSFCNFNKIENIVKELIDEGANVLPILSNVVSTTSTRFYKHKELKEKLKVLTKSDIIDNIVDAEPVGPNNLIDIMMILPCTGNTLAKLANAITDSPVLMVTKSHLRNNKKVILGISTNDALGLNAKNLGVLLNSKDIYFIPFSQDDPINKPKSLVFKSDYIVQTIEEAIKGKQIQPLIQT